MKKVNDTIIQVYVSQSAIVDLSASTYVFYWFGLKQPLISSFPTKLAQNVVFKSNIVTGNILRILFCRDNIGKNFITVSLNTFISVFINLIFLFVNKNT